jgi:hypothetical protein
LQANESDTVHLEDLFDVRWPNAPHRTLKNKTVDTWEAAGQPPSDKRPGEGEVIATSKASGPVVRYQSYTPGADAKGDIDAMSMWAGQGVGLVSRAEPPAIACAQSPMRLARFFVDWPSEERAARYLPAASRPQQLLKAGARFSMKAAMPSFRSSSAYVA